MTELTLRDVAEILVAVRMKLIKVIGIIAVVWALSYVFIADHVIEKVEKDLLPEGAKLITQAPLELLMLKIKVSLIFGFLAALPYIIYITYKTLKERTELLKDFEISKSKAILYAIVAAILFVMGVAYGYIVMLPLFLKFLYSIAQSQGVLALYSIAEFINFVVLMLAVFGVTFEMPLIMHFLVKNGIVDLSTFKYYRRHFYVVFFVIGAIITPPDVFTQLMVALPMILFFEVSLAVVSVTT